MSSDITLERCRPISEHARMVMAWRNDPHTLSMSYHKAPKQWPAFEREFVEKYFQIPQLPPMFLRAGSAQVGFLRFRPCADPESASGRSVELTIVIEPLQRGRGYAKLGLQLAMEFLRQSTDLHSVVAEVRQENSASHKLFLASGFRALNELTHTVEATGEECTITRYLYDLTPAYWKQQQVFVVAEAGSNWRVGSPKRDMAMARALIDVAVDAGADAVKFQTDRPESLYVANAGQGDYLAEAGIKQDNSTLFQDLAMPYEMVAELAAYCREQQIRFMSTPFSLEDFAAVDPHVDLHKLASYEISHAHLIRACAESGKPAIFSTGACGVEDIAWAVDHYRAHGGKDLCLMQSTASYPAPMESLNLRAISFLKNRFGVAVGLSDHSRHPIHGPVAAVGVGARVIEKHYTLDNHLPGPDHSFAILPAELKQMVEAIRAAEAALGQGGKRVEGAEEELASYARRGLQATRTIAKGEALMEGENVAILRPGQQTLGCHPRHLTAMQGQKATRAIAAGEGVQLTDWVAEES
uniref:Putative N-acetylneuraminate synthase n=1 Tax=Magnetococcus massalia (strain MO-1) TaxID=451514 RepID=A0A1S7LJY3_MAGMO|nr:Putative N-acetylneuraminate synthase [Candidatus Magnetococcus massalia]